MQGCTIEQAGSSPSELQTMWVKTIGVYERLRIYAGGPGPYGGFICTRTLVGAILERFGQILNIQ